MNDKITTKDHRYKNFDDETKKEMRIKSLRFKKTDTDKRRRNTQAEITGQMKKQRSDKGRLRTLKEQTMQLNNEGSKRERKKTFLEKKSV